MREILSETPEIIYDEVECQRWVKTILRMECAFTDWHGPDDESQPYPVFPDALGLSLISFTDELLRAYLNHMTFSKIEYPWNIWDLEHAEKIFHESVAVKPPEKREAFSSHVAAQAGTTASARNTILRVLRHLLAIDFFRADYLSSGKRKEIPRTFWENMSGYHALDRRYILEGDEPRSLTIYLTETDTPSEKPKLGRPHKQDTWIACRQHALKVLSHQPDIEKNLAQRVTVNSLAKYLEGWNTKNFRQTLAISRLQELINEDPLLKDTISEFTKSSAVTKMRSDLRK